MITRFVNVLVDEYIVDSVGNRVSDATEAYNFIQTQLLE